MPADNNDIDLMNLLYDSGYKIILNIILRIKHGLFSVACSGRFSFLHILCLIRLYESFIV